MKKTRYISDNEKHEICECFKKGESKVSISKRFGRCWQSVHNIVQDAEREKKARRVTPLQEKIRQLCNRNYTDDEICNLLDMDIYDVERAVDILQKNGAVKRQPKIPPAIYSMHKAMIENLEGK